MDRPDTWKMDRLEATISAGVTWSSSSLVDEKPRQDGF
ncbi:MAG: hypothetical protein KatS3mg111_0830 [Pirellulaceae bacterium]|nr:MAG: hypothetical protein KatS3mg111_0830 [Pirellulaceae bacterium]